MWPRGFLIIWEYASRSNRAYSKQQAFVCDYYGIWLLAYLYSNVKAWKRQLKTWSGPSYFFFVFLTDAHSMSKHMIHGWMQMDSISKLRKKYFKGDHVNMWM
jgi:hypothetical protein